jgi:hypothetical protein
MPTNSKTINITQKNIYGNCDLKCSYSFNYNPSNSVATNKGVYLSLSYDKGTSSPVTYNNQKYHVSNINIYNNSLHMFDDNFVSSEIIIEHTPDLGGDLLYVCIPIIKSQNNSSASTTLGEIIKIIGSSAPVQGETTNLNISNFNLNDIIPKKPFYAYTGTNGLQGQVIVFGLNNAIALSSTIIDSLTKIIKTYPLTVEGGNLFFNKIGPNNIHLDDDIYISCQPTGSSKEEIQVSYNKSGYSNNNFADIFSNSNAVDILKFIFLCIFFIVLFMFLSFVYNRLSSSPTKLFTKVK